MAVISYILTDNSAVFLPDEAVVVFLMVAASCKGDAVIFTTLRGVVDEFRAVIAVKLRYGPADVLM